MVAACLIGFDGGKGCHSKFDQYEIPVPPSIMIQLKGDLLRWAELRNEKINYLRERNEKENIFPKT
jgi:hypothetical protein